MPVHSAKHDVEEAQLSRHGDDACPPPSRDCLAPIYGSGAALSGRPARSARGGCLAVLGL